MKSMGVGFFSQPCDGFDTSKFVVAFFILLLSVYLIVIFHFVYSLTLQVFSLLNLSTPKRLMVESNVHPCYEIGRG